MMTKAVNKEKLDKYMGMTKQKVVEGRAKEALHVKKDNGGERKQNVVERPGEGKSVKNG